MTLFASGKTGTPPGILAIFNNVALGRESTPQEQQFVATHRGF